VTSNQIISDAGTEFSNFHVQLLFKQYGIVHQSLRGKHKASVAERMIQTLKGRLEKYFWNKITKKYVNVIQQIVQNFYNTPYRSIGMAPSSVNSTDISKVSKKMY
jgi:hypothetical protein